MADPNEELDVGTHRYCQTGRRLVQISDPQRLDNMSCVELSCFMCGVPMCEVSLIVNEKKKIGYN